MEILPRWYVEDALVDPAQALVDPAQHAVASWM